MPTGSSARPSCQMETTDTRGAAAACAADAAVHRGLQKLANGASFIEEFSHVKRSLRDATGVSYDEFKRRLLPRYAVAWASIGAVYLAIVAAVMSTVAAQRFEFFPAPLEVIVGAFAFGFCVHCLLLFLHEAIHFNLARSRTLNDLLANVFLCPLLGLDLQTFRACHFEHHKYLGTPNDTETSYFTQLTPRFVIESLLGIRIVRALVERRRLRRRAGISGAFSSPARVLSSAALHLGIFVAGGYTGQYALATAWGLGVVVVAPSLNLIRQIIEHRDFEAKAGIDYTRVAHGAVVRNFGTGLFASTYGAAGFNRHLLHHLEPQISCTRLRELEAFLDTTTMGPRLAECRATYATAFARLMRA